MNKVQSTLLFSIFMGTYFGCELSKQEEENVPVTSLCLTPQDMPGWSAWEFSCHSLTPNDLQGQGDPSSGGMNGGADFYNNNGMLSYVYQKFTHGGQSLAVYVMDFGKASNAVKMYNDTKDASECSAVPGYDVTEAVLCIYGGGSAFGLFANMGRYYFEMILQGLADTAEALSRAETSLNLYRRKIPIVTGVLND